MDLAQTPKKTSLRRSASGLPAPRLRVGRGGAAPARRKRRARPADAWKSFAVRRDRRGAVPATAACGVWFSPDSLTAGRSLTRTANPVGLMPSGVYHQELETTLPDRSLNIPEAWAERLFEPAKSDG